MRRLALCSVLLLVVPASAGAEISPWQRSEHVSVRQLISHAEESRGESIAVGGLQFVLEDGWKTYWRTPGDAGMPARITLEQSENVKDIRLLWPAPSRFIEAWGLESYGYDKEVVLPFHLVREEADQPSSYKIRVDYMICKEVCIPVQANFSGRVKSPLVEDSESRRIVTRFLKRVPEGLGDYRISPVRLMHRSAGVWAEVVIDSAAPMKHPDVFMEGPNGYVFGKPEQTVVEEGKMIRFSLPVATTMSEEGLEGAEVRVTLAESGGVAETRTTLSFNNQVPYLPGEAAGGVLTVVAWVLAVAGAVLVPLLTIKWRRKARRA